MRHARFAAATGFLQRNASLQPADIVDTGSGSGPGSPGKGRSQNGGSGVMLDLLKGIRVVSFNHFLLGPMGVQVLGDLGADVISIESAEGAWQRHWSGGNIWHDGQSALHLCANRNKRSVVIDLKSRHLDQREGRMQSTVRRSLCSVMTTGNRIVTWLGSSCHKSRWCSLPAAEHRPSHRKPELQTSPQRHSLSGLLTTTRAQSGK